MSSQSDAVESQVAELQAAVNGLTEELVETKERVRQLEEQLEATKEDAEPSAGPNQSSTPASAADSEQASQTEQTENTDSKPVTKTTVDGTHARVVERKAPDDGEDIVASGESEPGDEATNSTEDGQSDGEQSSDEEISDGSDIIIA